MQVKVDELHIFTLKQTNLKIAYFNWSSGKDSAFALYKILQDSNYSVKNLVTSVNKKYNRVSMHGVPEKLLDTQRFVHRCI